MAEETQIENNVVEEQQTDDLNVNVNAFMEEVDTPKAEDNGVQEESTTTEEVVNNNEENQPEDNYMSWDDINSNNEQVEPGAEFAQKSEEETNEQQTEEVTTEEPVVQQETQVIENEDAYKVLKQELGLSADSVADFKKELKDLVAENEELKQQASSNIDNTKINRLKGFKNLSDEKLLLESFKRQGFNEEEAQNAVDRYIDNQMLDIEAKKIRKGIDSAITKEQQNQEQFSQQEEARLQKEREESIESLKKYMGSLDTMYGLKIAKTDDDVVKVRKEHMKYITSGNFLNEVTENNENLVEASWLWKNRDVITKSFYNKGKNEERQSFMEELENHEVSNASNRIKGPGEDDGFNPTKFIQ